jgi:biopolymer transport protein ExbD
MFENHRKKKRLGHVIITPLIDVMFYLVAFLLVFGTFRTETTGMSMELPRAATPSDLAREHIIVAIDDRRCNQRPSSLCRGFAPRRI